MFLTIFIIVILIIILFELSSMKDQIKKTNALLSKYQKNNNIGTK